MTVIVISDNTTGADFSGLFAVEARESSSTTNYYSGGFIGRGVEIQSYGSGDRDHGFYFPTGISNVPSGATVSSAILSIYVTEASAPVSTFDIVGRRLLRDAVYSTLTWDDYDTSLAWGTPGALNATDRNSTILCTATITNGMSPAYVDFTDDALTAWVQAIVDGTYTNQGIVIECASDTAYDGRYLFSSDNTQTDGQRPKLTITYTTGGGVVIPVFMNQYRQRR